MQFILRYTGSLPSDGSPADKQRVRTAISPQLAELCERNEFFREALHADLLPAEYKNGNLSFHHDENHPGDRIAFCRVPLSGFDFVPLIHREYYLACQLDVTWLRREPAGRLLRGGDLDNRLKTLFDGLRMPHLPNEVGPETPKTPNERIYCLLDDDSLITKLSVETHQLLQPASSDADEARRTYVDLLIHVTVQITSRRWGNSGVGELVY